MHDDEPHGPRTPDLTRALAALDLAVIALDPSGRVALASPSACALLGCPPDEAQDRPLDELLAQPADGRAALALAERVGEWSGDLHARAGDGAPGRPIRARVVALIDGTGMLSGFAVRLSDPAAALDVDALTGLPSRDRFAADLKLELARLPAGTGLDVLLIALDSFDAINESLGNPAGDALMRQASTRLCEAAGSGGLVARQSAAQFLALARRGERGEGGEALAERIHHALEAPFLLDGIEFYIGASIGISRRPEDAHVVEAMLEHATAAMYQARDHEGHPTKVYESRTAHSKEHLSLATRLRKALERGEFVLDYQPLVDLGMVEVAGAAGIGPAVVGVEALMRWHDQDRGLIGPGQFMAVAEDTGLIELIGEWVFTEACRQARAWQDEGLELEVGVNLSLRQLLQPDLVADMVTAARRADIQPNLLVLEVGAATALGDANDVGPTLQQLAAAGFRIAVDELGGWHPSVGRLRELPVSRIKIDRTILAAALDDAQAETLLSSIIALGKRLDIPAVAVGIERVEELRFLVALGCRLGQGYLLCRPVPAERISALCAGGPAISPLPALQIGS